MNEEKVGPLFLIKQSLARLRAFRYVVAAAAAVTLASTVFIALEDLPKAVIGVVFLLMFAFLLIILESSRGTLEKSRPGRVLSLFVLWSIAVLFVGLTTAGGWYVVREILFPDESGTPMPTAEQEALRLRGVYSGTRGDWEAVVSKPNEQDWPDIATRAADLAHDFEVLDDSQLAPSFQILKYRFLGASRMIACHARTKASVENALSYCRTAITASSHALELIETAEDRKMKSAEHRKAADWVREEKQRDKIHRELTFQNALLYASSKQQSDLTAACCALSNISPAYLKEDPPTSSTVIAQVLPLCTSQPQAECQSFLARDTP